MGKLVKYNHMEKVGDCFFLSDTGRKAGGKRLGLFKCGYCDTRFEACISHVKRRAILSCGCYRRKNASRLFKTHGMSNTPLYDVWYHIKQRCYSPRVKNYNNYGGRGITVHSEWINDFQAFYDYVTEMDSYNRSTVNQHGLTLDRIDNDGNYEPGNLRWADRHIQNTNQKMKSNNTSGFTGVTRNKGKWVSKIQINGVAYRFGIFALIQDAVEIRDEFIIYWELWEYPLQSDKYTSLYTER